MAGNSWGGSCPLGEADLREGTPKGEFWFTSIADIVGMPENLENLKKI